MKQEYKKISDGFTQFLNRRLFIGEDGGELPKTKGKTHFFNECTTVFEEFMNQYKEADSRKEDKIVCLKPSIRPIPGPRGTNMMTKETSIEANSPTFGGKQ